MRLIKLLSISILFFLTFENIVSATPRYTEFSPNLFRGPRPTYQELKELADRGVKTILNIDNDEEAIADERVLTRSLKLNSIEVPLSGFWAPKDSDINHILKVLSDKDLQPVYIHCKHGQDRTSVSVGLYRVEIEGLDPELAYSEMLGYGFHEMLILLKSYFKVRVGLEDGFIFSPLESLALQK